MFQLLRKCGKPTIGAQSTRSIATSLEKLVQSDTHFDAIVIGAGIGGAAAALGLTTPQIAKSLGQQQVRDLNVDGLPRKKRVLVIDAEKDFCYHSTGRSAAIFSELYGSPTTQALSTATKPFLYNPQENGLSPDSKLVSRRGTVWLATEEQKDIMMKLYNESKQLIPSIKLISPDEVAKIVPWAIANSRRSREVVEERCQALLPEDAEALGLAREAAFISSQPIHGAILEPDAADMDVDSIWKTIVARAKMNGASFENHVRVAKVSSSSSGSSWELELVQGVNGGATATEESIELHRQSEEKPRLRITADLVLNAGGAWADKIGGQFGYKSIGLVPKRRTIMLFDPLDVASDFTYPMDSSSPGLADSQAYLEASATWPAVFDMKDKYYYKPDAGRILASPSDETPTDPCDAQPDEVDLALCAHRLQATSYLEPKQISGRWAGLRSFVKDKNFVIGFDERKLNPTARGGDFFWLAGLGGYGIQTCLGNARLIAGLVHEGRVPSDMEQLGLDMKSITPNRFK